MMRHRRRLRKKLHRRFLTIVCAYVVTFDDDLRAALLTSPAGTPFQIDGACSRGIARLMRCWGLVSCVAAIRRLSPETATVACWSQEFPVVRDEVVIFSIADMA